jgi:hypothetical protein
MSVLGPAYHTSGTVYRPRNQTDLGLSLGFLICSTGKNNMIVSDLTGRELTIDVQHPGG